MDIRPVSRKIPESASMKQIENWMDNISLNVVISPIPTSRFPSAILADPVLILYLNFALPAGNLHLNHLFY